MDKIRFLTKSLLRDLNTAASCAGWEYKMSPSVVEAVHEQDYLPVLASRVIKRRRVVLVMLNVEGEVGMVEMPKNVFNNLPSRPYSVQVYDESMTQH